MPEVQHSTVLDVGVHHIADVYAKAFLGAAENTGKTDSLVEELDSLIEDVLDAHPDLEKTLYSGLVADDQKTEIIDRIFSGRASETLVVFLKVLARHARLDCLRPIHRAVHHLVNEMRGRVEVELRVASPIEDDLATEITRSLRGALRGEPDVSVVVDPSLIAGAVVTVGDTVYDGCVASRLRQLRTQIIDISVEKIQASREQFLEE